MARSPAAELLHVFDLPQLYQKPKADTLLEILSCLKQVPRSWSTQSVESSTTTTRFRVDESDSTAITKYLTSMIASPLGWIEDDVQKEQIWEEASSRLSERSGRTGMPSMDRSFNIVVNGEDISIVLHEPALTADNLGFKTWAASYALAQKLESLPMPSMTNSDVRILELGAGTGLVGLAAAIVWKVSVCLTDLPDIVPNLQKNMLLNSDLVSSHGGKIVSGVLDWSQPERLEIVSKQSPERNWTKPHSYPLILAADSVYSEDHPSMLAQTIQHWLVENKDARVVLELPFRDRYENEMQLVRVAMELNGFILLSEDEHMGVDDWGSNTSDEQSQVRCWFSSWGWRQYHS